MCVGIVARACDALCGAAISARHRARLGALALATAFAVHASSEAQAETLREALAAAYAYNPKLDADRANQRATDEEIPRAESGYRPTVTGAADAGRAVVTTNPLTTSSGASSPYGFQVTVKQNLFNGFRTESAVATAEAGARAGRESLRQTEIATLLDAATAYMDVVRDQAILRLREANVGVLTKVMEAAETRRAVREMTRTDVAQAKARRAKAISAQDQAKANLKISRANYERVIGHAPQDLRDPPLKLKQSPASLEEATRIAEQENPNVIAALYREEAARHRVDLVRGELLPQLNVEASFGRQTDLSAYVQQQDAASVTGRLTVPFYEGGEIYARVRQAKHSHVGRLQEIELARSEAQTAVATAWSRHQAALTQLQADTIQVEASKVALEGVREEEKVGQRTLLDVLNAEQEHLDAQVAVIADRHDLVIANYALLAAIGRLTASALALTDTIYDAEAHADEVRGRWFGLNITHPDGRREVVEVVDGDSVPVDSLK